MISKDPDYQRKWRANNPGYMRQYNKAAYVGTPKPVTVKVKERQMEKEQEDKIIASHRQTIFTAGAKREGLLDRPYDEGEVL